MKLNKQTGQSLIEFALVLPLLLLLIMGIIEFSLVLFDQAVITNAAREGARAGIVSPHILKGYDHEYIKSNFVAPAVNNYCQNYLISFSPSTPEVDVNHGGQQDLTIIVTVSYQYNWLVFPHFVTVANPFQLRAVVQMRYE